MANGYMEKGSTTLSKISEKHMKCHLIPVRMTVTLNKNKREKVLVRI
jgi:hypothetical protein